MTHRETVATAPGKLVLVGEYAVLSGAPALVCAVPRLARVTLRLEDARGADPVWRIATPPLAETAAAYRWGPDGPADPPEVVDAVLASLAEGGFTVPPGDAWLTLDSRQFHDPHLGAKLGFGSSAALCTALMGALCRAHGWPASLALALDAHRRLQGGAGSGIDVAASWQGGVLSFQPGATPGLTPLTWPDGLFAQVVWTGQPASTTDRLRRLAGFQKQRPERARSLMQALRRHSAAATAALADPDRFLALCRQFSAVLDELATEARLDVWTPAHRKAAALASGHGVFYKTSGAGGGDCGLAMSTDPAALELLAETLTGQGLANWPLVIADQGLHTTAALGG